jgi:hypothetical protein
MAHDWADRTGGEAALRLGALSARPHMIKLTATQEITPFSGCIRMRNVKRRANRTWGYSQGGC